MSNRDRHVKQFHENSNNTTCENIIDLNVNAGEIDEEFPTMVSIGSHNVQFNVNKLASHKSKYSFKNNKRATIHRKNFNNNRRRCFSK